jgi:hypothetical protein
MLIISRKPKIIAFSKKKVKSKRVGVGLQTPCKDIFLFEKLFDKLGL